MDNRPIETCSPVEAMTSSSRGEASGFNSLAIPEQAIGLARHGGRHDHEAVAFGGEARHAPRDLADALGAAHGGAAVLLDDEGHGRDT